MAEDKKEDVSVNPNNLKPVTIEAISSPTIGKLAKALAKAQGSISNPKKDSENPFFKSKYADLAACLGSSLPIISEQGLSITQLMQGEDLHTVLMHESGEWIKSVYPVVTTKKDAQGWGSGITYARRYTLCAIIGIAQEDDDGTIASLSPAPKPLTKEEINEVGLERMLIKIDDFDNTEDLETFLKGEKVEKFFAELTKEQQATVDETVQIRCEALNKEKT